MTVLEARDRVGGRVRTLDDLPGKPEADRFARHGSGSGISPASDERSFGTH